MIELFLIVLLIALNGFFVAAEFALVKVRLLRLTQISGDLSLVTKLNRKMRIHLESYLAACQLGITMASIALGWVGEPAFAKLLLPLFNLFNIDAALVHTVAFLVGFVIISSLHLVIGEQVPKTFAIRKPERVALWVALPLEVFYLVSRPLNRLLNKSSSWTLHRLGVEEVSYVEHMTGEELREMIDFSEEHGGIESQKAEMLNNLFEFDARSVSQIMVPRNETTLLDVQDAPENNIKKMIEFTHSRMPLVDGDPDKIVGIILVKELFYAALSGQAEPWRNLRPFAREALIVPETMSVGKLFETMRRKQAMMALIVDEYGAFAGLVTMEDLLEEIVGEISDELDDAKPEYSIEQTAQGWVAHGLTSLTDIARALDDFEVPDEVDANTLSGLIMHELQDIPQVGNAIQFSGYEIVVEEIKDRYVEKAKLTLLPRESSVLDEDDLPATQAPTKASLSVDKNSTNDFISPS